MRNPKELLVIRFRLLAFVAAGTIAVAALSHPAGAATSPGPAPSPAAAAPAPSPAATPEPMDVQIPRLEAKIKADPNDKESMTTLATDYLQVQRPDLAVQLTQKLLQGGTKNAQIYFVDGESQLQLGKQDAGIASMEQASDLEPTNFLVLQALTSMYLNANRPADAERVAKRAVTFNTSSKDALENYGFVFAAEKKYDDARAQFQAAYDLDPKDPHPLVLIARTYEDANELPSAMPYFDKALVFAPTALEVLVGKAELASAMHDVKTSVATYQLVLAQMPDDPNKAAVTDQIAAVYAREKMDSDADAAYRQAIDSYGGLAPAHIAYGDYLAGKKDDAGALREWTTALGANRDNPDALARLAQAAMTKNDYTTGVADYKRLTEVVPSDPRTFLLLGQAYMTAKNWNAARDAFKASYNLQQTPDALVGLAAADQEARNFTEAIEIYEALDKNAQPLIKANPVILLDLGNAYKGANQTQKAKDTYTRFLAFLKPGTQGYDQVKQMIAELDHPSAARPASPKPAATPSAAPKH